MSSWEKLGGSEEVALLMELEEEAAALSHTNRMREQQRRGCEVLDNFVKRLLLLSLSISLFLAFVLCLSLADAIFLSPSLALSLS